MIEFFMVHDEHVAGDAIYAHRPGGGGVPLLGRACLTRSGLLDGSRSDERIGTLTKPIEHGAIVEVDGADIRVLPFRDVVGTVDVDPALAPAAAPLPRDHLLAAALARETAAIGKRYVPDRHTDFDAEHGWLVTMEMGRGG